MKEAYLSAMDSESQPLHILFFPFMASGHMNPMIDMAKLFTRQGVRATILTTPANALLIQPTVDRANEYSVANFHHPITIILIPFPSIEAGLPEGCENPSSLPTPNLQINFLKATYMLRQPFHRALTDLSPDCVVTDMFFPWTCDVAAEHNVPRLVFQGTSFFSRCAADSVEGHKPLESLPPDVKSFILPGLPHRIEMLRTNIIDFVPVHEPEFLELSIQAKESELRSYGMLVNSFYELEPEYVEHYRKVIGRKAWSIGPVSLCNEDEIDMFRRGNKPSIDCEACLKWLDSRTPGSVVYVCFGSLHEFPTAQLHEIALGLESSDRPFIWVVRSRSQNWLPEGYEERINGRGLLIKGWAPQVLILNHHAIGGFVTHCGWNACLEGVSARLPFVTWPIFAEQFYNERMIVDVLEIGVSMGVEYSAKEEEKKLTEAAEIDKAVNELMGSGDEAESRRQRARLLGDKARRALEEGGTSHVDMGNLITELKYNKGTVCLREGS